jgi:hypothetical protein
MPFLAHLLSFSLSIHQPSVFLSPFKHFSENSIRYIFLAIFSSLLIFVLSAIRLFTLYIGTKIEKKAIGQTKLAGNIIMCPERHRRAFKWHEWLRRAAKAHEGESWGQKPKGSEENCSYGENSL